MSKMKLEMAKILLSKGVYLFNDGRLDFMDRDGNTYSMCLSDERRDEMLELLLKEIMGSNIVTGMPGAIKSGFIKYGEEPEKLGEEDKYAVYLKKLPSDDTGISRMRNEL
jgi:hypothetical protein